jgi:hypothetical protein
MVATMLAAAAAAAQPVIVQGPVAGPGSDPLAGTCVITPSVQFVAADGKLVAGQLTVPFAAGVLRVALEPNDTASVLDTSYTADCTAPPQIVTGTDGKRHTSGGEWVFSLYVRTAPASAALADVLVPLVPTPNLQLTPPNFGGTYATGAYCVRVVNGRLSLVSTGCPGTLANSLVWNGVPITWN